MTLDARQLEMELCDPKPLKGYEREVGRIARSVRNRFEEMGLKVDDSNPEVYEADLPTVCQKTYQRAFGWGNGGELIEGWVPIGQIYGAYDTETGRHYIDRSVTGGDEEKRGLLERTGLPILSLEEVLYHEHTHHAQKRSGLMDLYEFIARKVSQELNIEPEQALTAFIEGLAQLLTEADQNIKTSLRPYAEEVNAMYRTVRDCGLRNVINPTLEQAKNTFRRFVDYWNGPRYTNPGAAACRS